MAEHVYAHNISAHGVDDCEYEWTHYSLETRKAVSGKLKHQRDDGLRALVSKILLTVDKRLKK